MKNLMKPRVEKKEQWLYKTIQPKFVQAHRAYIIASFTIARI